MSLWKRIPLRFRRPLTHRVLFNLSAWRSRSWQKADATQRIEPGDFVVTTFYHESSGIARGGRLTASALRSTGYDLIEHDLRPVFKRILRSDAQLPGSSGVWLIHANPPELLVALLGHTPDQWANRYRITYWAWETPLFPASWVWLADYVHEIWVPSTFVHDAIVAAFREAGREDLSPRVRVMPHPVPVPPCERHEAARTRFGLQSGVCEVLCLFDTKSSATRKNPWAVLTAWRKAFPAPTPQARLTLKVNSLAADLTTDARLKQELEGRSDIRLLTDRFSDAEMTDFVASFDLLISLHRSEGFGLPLAEAMAAGVPVVATGWSGNLEFCDQKNAALVPYTLVPIRDPDGFYSGLKGDAQVWAEPDIDAAADLLGRLSTSSADRAMLARNARASVGGLLSRWQGEAIADLPFNAHLKSHASTRS